MNEIRVDDLAATQSLFVTGSAPEVFSHLIEIFDTTIGWRFAKELMKVRLEPSAVGPNDLRAPQPARTSRRCSEEHDCLALQPWKSAGIRENHIRALLADHHAGNACVPRNDDGHD
jgi:hypothetical protein